MPTTLDIDIDVLNAAEDPGRREKKSTGQVVSEVVRVALTARHPSESAAESHATHRFRPFPQRGGIVTNELVDRLRESGEY